MATVTLRTLVALNLVDLVYLRTIQPLSTALVMVRNFPLGLQSLET